nr:hypothetical protein [Tanacetum cinerariifolium]
MHQTHISQPSGSGADKGTGDDNKEQDDDGDEEDEGDDGEEENGDDDDDEDDDSEEGADDDVDQEFVRDDDKDDDEEGGDSEDEGDGEEDLGLNIGEEERHDEEEEEDELYRDVNINQGRGLQGTLEVEDTHVTLTPVKPDGQQESSSVLRFLEEHFSEVTQTNQFAGAVSAIPEIVQHYMDQRMNEAVKVAIQIQSDRLCKEAQRENDEFLRTVDENIKKIIKEQVKEQVKAQVSKILPRIEQAMNEQLEAEDLYKALVDAYESDKIILETYGETVTLKRRHDVDEDKDEEPSAGPDRGKKRCREGKEPESASAPSETATKSAGRSTTGSRSRQASVSESAFAEEPVQTTSHMEEPSHPEFDTDNRGRRVIPFAHFISNDLEYLRGGASSRKYTTSVTKTKGADYGHIKWIEDLFYSFAVNRESAHGVYSKRRIIAVTELKIVEWHSYKYLDWITVRRDNDKLYKFKEGDFKRLHFQDIEDMLPLLVQGKLTNLTVEERFSFNVSLRMFTRSIVIQRRVEDLQLGVKSYQKRHNLTKPDTYRSDLKRKEAYTAYSNPRGFIYQNKDKKNRLMRIDELHKFSDGMLTDICTALDDRLKGIRMRYLPQTIWRKSDKDRAAAMIQAIDKRLITRVMRSLERFVGGSLYGGDFRMLQRTI